MLAISVGANFRNTFSLLNERAITLLNGMEQAIRVETGRAEGAVLGLARLYAGGAFEIGDSQNVGLALRSILSAEEKIEGLLLMNIQGGGKAILRDQHGNLNEIPMDGRSAELKNNFRSAILNTTERPVWGEPTVVQGVLFHNVSIPARAGRKGAGPGRCGAWPLNHEQRRFRTRTGQRHDCVRP